MPTGTPKVSHAELKLSFCCCAALAFALYSTLKTEEQAICVQTGPTSFQIVDVRKPAKPVVLWDAKGRYDRTQGPVDRKKRG